MVSFGLLLLPEGPLDRSLVQCSILSFVCFWYGRGWFRAQAVSNSYVPGGFATDAGLLWVQRELDLICSSSFQSQCWI